VSSRTSWSPRLEDRRLPQGCDHGEARKSGSDACSDPRTSPRENGRPVWTQASGPEMRRAVNAAAQYVERLEPRDEVLFLTRQFTRVLRNGVVPPRWWAHLVGARRVNPHKHCANGPPQKAVRGLVRFAPVLAPAITATVSSGLRNSRRGSCTFLLPSLPSEPGTTKHNGVWRESSYPAALPDLREHACGSTTQIPSTSGHAHPAPVPRPRRSPI
jgi:hypothetical protein